MEAIHKWEQQRECERRAFAAEFEPWLQQAFKKLPYEGWRQEWRGLCARVSSQGINVTPASAAEVEAWLAGWEQEFRAEDTRGRSNVHEIVQLADQTPTGANPPHIEAPEGTRDHAVKPTPTPTPVVPIDTSDRAGTIEYLKKLGHLIMQSQPPERRLAEAKKDIAALSLPERLEVQARISESLPINRTYLHKRRFATWRFG